LILHYAERERKIYKILHFAQQTHLLFHSLMLLRATAGNTTRRNCCFVRLFRVRNRALSCDT
jgi:hypothetical protein